MSKRTIDQVDGQELPAHPARSTRARLATPDSAHSPLKLAYPSVSKSSQPIKPPPFQKPLSLLNFSYTPEPRQLRWDNSSLRYYADPPPRADLGYGYERWVRREDEKGRLDSLLGAWMRAKGETLPADFRAHGDEKGPGVGSAKGMDVGVVTWRGVMTKILTAPYEERDSWEMNAMRVGETMYLEEHLSAEQLKKKNVMEPRHRLQSYFGYAFESYCTTDTLPRAGHSIPLEQEGHPPGWSGDVDTNAQWCSVVKTKLGNTRIVIGGEVDCVRGEYDGGTDRLVELKTSMVIRGQQDEVRFEKKLLKFYFQSFLLGVPEIVVGFRTPSGHLQTMQSLQTIKIPSMIRGKPHAWDPSLCLDWGHKFLEFLKATTSAGHLAQNSKQSEDRSSDEGDADSPPRSQVEENSRRVWRVKFTPRDGVQCFELESDSIETEVCGGDNSDGGRVERVGFLPSWYFKHQVEEAERRTAQADALKREEDASRELRPRVEQAPTPQDEHGHALKQEPLTRSTKVAGWQI